MSMAMLPNVDDRGLVAAHLGGDRAALAEIYDRYAASLYDTAAAMLQDRDEAADAVQEVFVVAAQKLGQLRQPERLRAWLYAILRNEVFLRSKRRRRSVVIDLTAPASTEMAAPVDPRAEAASVEFLELAGMLRAAAAGLDERDQLVMELSVRQGLAGAELAGAVGVTESQGYVLVHRMRERLSRSLGALAVARAGRRECAELDALLADWDGTFSVLIRKRVARHVERCQICAGTRDKAGVIGLLGIAPAFALPDSLRDQVLASATSSMPGRTLRLDEAGFPKPLRSQRRRPAGAAAMVAAIVAAVIGVGVAVAGGGGDGTGGGAPVSSAARAGPVDQSSSSDSTASPSGAAGAGTDPASSPAPPTSSPSSADSSVPGGSDKSPVAPPGPSTSAVVSTSTTVPGGGALPGTITLSSSVVDLGATATSGTLTLTNTGGSTVAWSIPDGAASPTFIWSAGSGSLDPGHFVDVSVSIDRSAQPEGEVRYLYTVRGSGIPDQRVEVRATVERAPSVTIVRGVSTLQCPWRAAPTIEATVDDESSITSVTLRWEGPGPSGSSTMTSSGGDRWQGSLGIARVDGTWTYTVVAIDARGNAGSSSGQVVVRGCSSR